MGLMGVNQMFPQSWNSLTQKHTLTHTGLEELAADALVHADGSGHLFHVSTGGLTQSWDGVYTADTLS